MRRIVLIALTLISCVPAIAADAPRKIDFTVVLKDQDDAAFEECADFSDKECKVKRPLTLGAVAMRSLATPEQGLDPVEANKRGYLAISLYKSVGAELTADEIVLLKKQIAKAYSPVVAYRAFSILDPASSPK